MNVNITAQTHQIVLDVYKKKIVVLYLGEKVETPNILFETYIRGYLIRLYRLCRRWHLLVSLKKGCGK